MISSIIFCFLEYFAFYKDYYLCIFTLLFANEVIWGPKLLFRYAQSGHERISFSGSSVTGQFGLGRAGLKVTHTSHGVSCAQLRLAHTGHGVSRAEPGVGGSSRHVCCPSHGCCSGCCLQSNDAQRPKGFEEPCHTHRPSKLKITPRQPKHNKIMLASNLKQ